MFKVCLLLVYEKASIYAILCITSFPHSVKQCVVVSRFSNFKL